MIRYLLSLLSVAAITLFVLLPVHNFQRNDFEALVKIVASSNAVILFGNSVIDTPSKCDSDKRTIADFADKNSSDKIVDASRGGLKLGSMLDLMEVGVFLGARPKLVIFTINPYDGNYFQTAKLKTGLSSYLAMNMPKIFVGNAVNGTESITSFNGLFFGDYNMFSKNEFILEKKYAKCPESIGVNSDFLKFMYYRNFLATSDQPLDAIDFKQRIANLNRYNIRVLTVLMPVDIDDIDILHGPSAVRAVRARADNAKRLLSDTEVLDLSFDLSAEFYSDRFCACGHLTQNGRSYVAARFQEKLSQLGYH